ncbi:CCR4-NOT transcription complex subunit 6-like-B [Podospora conica]|nr:CCR4-NOT transcription complex subunit 6-like-B [Schizothecium conicum]
MADEPTLPTLTGAPWSTAAPQGLSSLTRPRGARRFPREFVSPAYTDSSDPPVFSSDDSPALDNYSSGGRRKKRYVGPWFEQQPALSSDASMDSGIGEDAESRMLRPSKRRAAPTEHRSPRKFKRQMDSGVWLARGDLSSTDNEDIEMTPPPARLVLTRPSLSVEEREAQDLVRRCQNDGNECVDLNSLNLKAISDTTLEAINQIAPIPHVFSDVPFEQRPPAIKLYLAANGIDRFPAGILNIKHLTVLSLRGNNLKELPPALASLTNLKFLNVAQNALQFLPAELLTLLKPRGRLEDLKCQPNPFFDIKEDEYHVYGPAEYEAGTFGVTEETRGEGGGIKLEASLRARSPVQFSHRGTVVSNFKLPPPHEVSTGVRWNIMEQEEFWHLRTPKATSSLHGQRRGPASLFEQALRAAVTRTDHDEIQELLRDPTAPDHFLPTFQRAAEMEDMGGQSCCVCKREMVVPATEWVEFRELRRVKMGDDGIGETSEHHPTGKNREECLVPFLRRGCSWHCIPFKVPEKPGMQETRPLVE